MTFSSALGTLYMPTENVSLSDLIGVVDMTLSCLVTWLEGHSLAQTVFTNLYLHAPQLVRVYFPILLDLPFDFQNKYFLPKVLPNKKSQCTELFKSLNCQNHFFCSLQVNHPLLSTFSVLILKLIDLIRDLVSKGSVFEEEDFQPFVYGFKLCQVNIY